MGKLLRKTDPASIVKQMKKAKEVYNRQIYLRGKMSGMLKGYGSGDDRIFFEAHKHIIEAYRNLDERYKEDSLDNLVTNFRLYERSKASEESGTDNLLGQSNLAIKDEIDENDEDSFISEEEKDKKDDLFASGLEEKPLGKLVDVSKEQKKALQEIAAWMYRNADKEYLPFLNAVLRKTDREKLFIYYLVEKNLHDNYNVANFHESQNYIPDSETFRKYMKTSAGVFWKEKIRWDKIENAIQASDEYRDLYESYSIKQNNLESSDSIEYSDEDSTNEINIVSADMERKCGNLDKNLKKYHRLLAGKNLAKTKSENEKIDRELRTLAADIQNDMKELFDARDTLWQLAQNSRGSHFQRFQTVGTWMGETSKLGKIIFANTKSAVGIGASGNTQGAFDFSGPWIKPDAPVNKDFNADLTSKSTFYNNTAANVLKFADMGLSSVNAVLSVMSFVASLASMVKVLKSAPAKEKVMSVFTFVGSMSSAANDTYGAVQKIWEFSTAGLKLVGGSLTIASGVMDVGLGATKMIRAQKSINKLNQATDKHNERIRNEGATKDDKTYEKMSRMLKQKFLTEQIEGDLSVMSGALKVASGIIAITGVAAPLGAIVGVAAGLVSLASTIASYKLKKNDHKRAVDDYLETEKVTNDVKAKLDHVGGMWRYGFKDKDALRDQVRTELLARIYCHNIEGGYRYVARQYASLLYRRAFFRKNGKAFTDNEMKSRNNTDPELKIARDEYQPILKSLKITPKYPKTKDELPPKIDVKQIMAKMM